MITHSNDLTGGGKMKNKVMVIDDDKLFLEEMETTLTLNDYDVVTLSDSYMAVDKVIESRPDVILLDMKMPDDNGLQVASKIKYFSAFKKVPIIAITGSLSERHKSLMKNYGISSYMLKPVDPIELILNIERAL